MTSKKYLADLITLLESKDHIIDRLDLTDGQKEELKSFFKAHPNYESKIDWNNKALTYGDFKSVLDLEGKSRNSIKKYGLSGKAQIEDLVEGKDYEIVKQEPAYTLYYVKTFKGSEVLARPTTPPEGITGKWCIAGRNYSPGTDDHHWTRYNREGYGFFFVFTPKSKYALSCKTNQLDQVFTDPGQVFQCFSKDDNQIASAKWSKTIQQAIHELTHSEFFSRFIAEVEERQYQIQQQRQKNTEALEQEITKVMKDLEKGTVDPKYTRLYQAAKAPDEINNQLELNLWNTWFKNGVRYDSNDLDLAEVFRFMRQLEIPSIKIPDNIAVIGNSCFANFLELKEVIISPSVKLINSKAFLDAGIRTIQIPKTVKYLGPGIFQGCQYLESVKFEGPILGLDPDTGQTQLPGAVFSGSWSLFSGNYSLTDVELPENWTVVPDMTFERCCCLRHIHLSDSITEFGNGAFFKCGALREIPWTASLQEVGSQAFGFCKALREIIVPETVQRIGYKAFTDCICDRVVFPRSLKELSKFSLWGLDAKEIIFKGTKMEWADLISKSYLGQYGSASGNSMPGIWYARHILPVLKFQPEN